MLGLPVLNYQLRDYQADAVKAALDCKNGILVLPTGSGKSLVCAGIVEASGKTIVLQPTKEILESNFEKIISFGFKGATMFSASVGIKEVGLATYATIGSIIKHVETFKDYETIIVDECHLVNAKGGQYEQFIKLIKPKRLIGMTATPYRLHSSSWGSQMRILTRTRPKIFKDIIYITQTRDLLETGYLHGPEFIVSGKEGTALLEANSTGAEYSEGSIKKYLKITLIVSRIEAAVDNAIENGMKHILVFVPTLDRSDEVLNRMVEKGIPANSVSGKTPKREREEALGEFRSGEIHVMVNVGVLTTGYDFPELDCIVCARPTMSLSLYYQIIGRCVRPHPDKKRVIVYDLVNNFAKFGDPLKMCIVKGRTGLWDVMNEEGRLTGRYMEGGPEMYQEIEFGKHRNKQLRQVPTDYLEWYIENSKKSPTWHQFAAEIVRREIYNPHGTLEGLPEREPHDFNYQHPVV